MMSKNRFLILIGWSVREGEVNELKLLGEILGRPDVVNQSINQLINRLLFSSLHNFYILQLEFNSTWNKKGFLPILYTVITHFSNR